jgi:digeranylgeranylglycerophospholipid reductase
VLRSSFKEAEVLVVGASVAGLCAAYSAARAGARTLLVDAASEIGARPNPATLLTEPIWRRIGLSVPPGAVERELSGLRMSGPSGSGPLFGFRVFHLDRRAFDLDFVRMAVEAGAEVRSGVRVDAALPSGGVRTGNGLMRVAVTIFADGAGSCVREAMPTMRDPWEASWGLAQLLEAPGLGRASCCEVRFGSFAPGWRTQLNPLGGDRASLWTFTRDIPREELRGYAERARRSFPEAEEATILKEHQGVDPAFVMPGRIAGDGVMACGVAAGQGGLEFGARAGLLAGEVAAQAVRVGDTSRRTLNTYEKVWRRETAAASRTFRWGMSALRRLSDAELDDLFEDLSGVELGEEDLLALLRRNPCGPLQSVGARRSIMTLSGMMRGWIRAAKPH